MENINILFYKKGKQSAFSQYALHQRCYVTLALQKKRGGGGIRLLKVGTCLESMHMHVIIALQQIFFFDRAPP